MKTIALMAFAFMANVAMGQSFKVTSHGNPVENGAVIDVPYVFEDFSYPEYEMYNYSFMWNPELEAVSTNGNIKLDVTVTSLDNTEGLQICWPGQCHYVDAGGSYTSSGTIGSTPEDLKIHKEVALEVQGALPERGGSAKITIKSGSESVECTLNYLLEDANGVGENFAESNLPTTYYTLEGIQIEKPTAKGMYIVRKGNKSKVMLKK